MFHFKLRGFGVGGTHPRADMKKIPDYPRVVRIFWGWGYPPPREGWISSSKSRQKTAEMYEIMVKKWSNYPRVVRQNKVGGTHPLG